MRFTLRLLGWEVFDVELAQSGAASDDDEVVAFGFGSPSATALDIAGPGPSPLYQEPYE